MRGYMKFLLAAMLLLAAFVLIAEVKLQYRVVPESCIGCQLCVRACPTKAISMDKGKAVIDQDACIQCGLCQGKCPVNAIVVDTLQVEPATEVSEPEAEPTEPEVPTEPTPEPEPAPEATPETGSVEIIEVVEEVAVETVIAEPELPGYAVHSARCIGCLRCGERCPVSAIGMEGGKAVIDQEACIHCGICQQVCPVNAVASTE